MYSQEKKIKKHFWNLYLTINIKGYKTVWNPSHACAKITEIGAFAFGIKENGFLFFKICAQRSAPERPNAINKVLKQDMIFLELISVNYYNCI